MGRRGLGNLPDCLLVDAYFFGVGVSYRKGVDIMTAFTLSLIRTWVPVIAGSIISWLAVMGLQIDTEGEKGLTIFLTGLLIGLYYLIIRLIGKKFPQIEVLLGSAKSPDTYSKGDVVKGEVVSDENQGNITP